MNAEMDEAQAGMGPSASVTSDGFTVTSNDESAESIRENLESQPKPKDGEPPDPEAEEKEAVSKAAAKLGEKGGKAAAEKRAAEPEEKAEPKEEKPLGKPRDDPKARMLEATRKEAEAKRQLAEERKAREELARRLEALEARTAQPKQEQSETKPKDAKPVEADFENYGDFVEARSRWAAREEYRQAQAEAARHQYADHYAKRIMEFQQSFSKRMAEATANDPDLVARIQASEIGELVPSYALQPGTEPTVANHLADELLTSEMAPVLLNHLAQNEEEWWRLKGLKNQREVAREIAKLEVKLTPAEEEVPKGPRLVASKAPPPFRPVNGAPPVSDDLDDDTPFEVHLRKMNARERASRAGR